MKAIFSIVIFSILSVPAGFSQNDKENSVATAIGEKKYIFKARTMMPAGGGTMQLTSSYDFTLKNDSAIAYLPYFGRAYTANIGKGREGVNFTSTDFSYKVKKSRKGSWSIQIKPNDTDDVQQLTLNISKNGYGTLHVNNQNRQAISYSGHVEPLPENK